MKELDVLNLFIEQIEEVVPDSFVVRMSSHDEDHQADMVLLDNLNTERSLRSTNPYIRMDESGNGEVLHYYYNARLDLIVQSEDEVVSYETRQEIIEQLRPYEKYPTDFHHEIVKFELGDGGKREVKYEPTVFRSFRQVQSFNFSFFDEQVVDSEVLEEIEDNLED